ncbi:hypothetical protein Tco_1345118 [Tanacetum coccineum]
MGDANPIRTLGDYSIPSHEGYRNTIKLPEGNNVVPLRSDTIIGTPNADAVYSNPHPRNQNEPPNQKPFAFRERTGLNPQPQALGTSFEAQVRDYMAAHTERMERAPKKVLIREEAKYPVTKNVNSISLTRGKEEKNDENDVTTVDDIEKTDKSDMKMPVKKAEKDNEAKNGTKNKPIKRAEREEAVKSPSSKPVGYYLKRRINEKLIKGLVDNHRFKDSLLGARVEKMKGKIYKLLPRGPVYNAILKKKGSDVNVMPLSTYMKLTDKNPVETDIRLSLASHSYIYPFGIAEDVLVDVARIPESFGKVEKGIKNDIEPIAPTMTVNRLVLEWEERIKLHQEEEMKFDQWRSKHFKNKHPALVEVKGEMNEGEVTKFFKENEKKIILEAGDGVMIYPDGVIIFYGKKLGSS